MTTGEKTKQLRKARGLTQEELGNMIGVQKAAINKYETGIVVNLKSSTISALAKALCVSPLDLMDPEEPPALSPGEQLLVDTFRIVSDDGKAYLVQQAQIAAATFGKKSDSVPDSDCKQVST